MRLRLAILAAVGVAVALYLVRYVGWHAVLAAAGAIARAQAQKARASVRIGLFILRVL